MSALLVTSPDSQVGLLLRLDPGAESVTPHPALKHECLSNSRQAPPLRPGNRLEDRLL